MSPTRAALEAALAADPDDPARHAAYADLLLEEGDPRGEFVRLQLALEDPELPADRREAMQRAADALWKRHVAEWLGLLNQYTSFRHPQDYPPVVILEWRRGWIDRVEISDSAWPALAAVGECPTAKLVRSITVLDGVTPYLGAEPDLSFEGLSRTAVRHLCVWLPDWNDDLADVLIRSGLIAQLHDLDLSRNQITDDGAAALAACPDVLRLKSLTLDGNLISPIGVAALAEVGVRVGPQFWDRGRGDAYV